MNKAENHSLYKALSNNGIHILALCGLILIFSGLFVIAQSFAGELLPHDVKYIGISTEKLAKYYGGRINNFMFHDRVSYGGSIISVGIMYLWLAFFPLKNRENWAWWLFLISGIVGFGSFLTYLGYGYLDTWHGNAIIAFIPVYILGLIESKNKLGLTLNFKEDFKLKNSFIKGVQDKSQYWGYYILLYTNYILILAGVVIMGIGMTVVFVPEDLQYIDTTLCGLENINIKLIPLIAHDRACFGGGLANTGFIISVCIIKGKNTVNLWQAIFIALVIGFASAIGIHFYVGYLNVTHLAPAYIGAILAASGLIFTYKLYR